MKLTKKAKAFLKEVDAVAPLLSKECVACKHYNPNHLILINDEEGYKIICNQCKNPKTVEIIAPISEIAVSVIEEVIDNAVDPAKTVRSKKIKISKPKKEKVVKKRIKKEPLVEESKELNVDIRETIYSADNSINITANLDISDWNRAYGEPPKGFKGRVWLAESPDPKPIKSWVDENGNLCKTYRFDHSK